MTQRGDVTRRGLLPPSLVVVVVLLVVARHVTSASGLEYCDWEQFNVSCAADEVLAVSRGRYGRMNLGRCVTTNYGSIGCGADVTSHLDGACSGRRACALSVISLSQLPQQTNAPCPPDFKYYLEAEYECLKVYPNISNTQTCSAGTPSPLVLDGAATGGFLSSSVTQEIGLGGPSCPWQIRVEPHQRINITLFDFSLAPPASIASAAGAGVRGSQQYVRPSNGPAWEGPSPVQSWPGTPCDEYAVISEAGVGGASTGGTGTTGTGNSKAGGGTQVQVGRNATVCGRRRRRAIVYVSDSNIVQVRLDPTACRLHRFVLKYEAFGCPPLVAPPGAWVTAGPQHAFVQCNGTAADGSSVEDQPRWRLTCRGTSWYGHVGNCTAPASQFASLDRQDEDWMFGNGTNFPYGILFVIALGVLIGVIAGVLMLLAVLAYMRQRRQRRKKATSSSRAHYGLHETDELTGSSIQTYDDDRPKRLSVLTTISGGGGSGIYARTSGMTPIYKPQGVAAGASNTWQRTRPLPRPRSRSDNADSSRVGGGRTRTSSCDDCCTTTDDDDAVMAMTPLTSSTISERPLLSPCAGVDAGETSAAPCGDFCAGELSTERRSWHEMGNCSGSRGLQRQFSAAAQPMNPCRLLLGDSIDCGGAVAAVGTGGGYERCRPGAVDQPASTAPNSAGPYYFKLDLTAGLQTGPGRAAQQTGGVEDAMPGSPQCLICLQQQQQQQQQHVATLSRRGLQLSNRPSSPVARCTVTTRY